LPRCSTRIGPVALTVEGVHLGDPIHLVARVLSIYSTKRPLHLAGGSTANTTVVIDLSMRPNQQVIGA
jgi:hypothetical protein